MALKKVPCHRAEVAKDFWCCTTDSVLCNVMAEGKFSSESNEA